MGNPNDKIYTPSYIVDEVLDIFSPMIEPNHRVLEPFKGLGAFYEKLPEGRTSWCEIDEGVDFLCHEGAYDWIVTNPPYSTFGKMLPRMLDMADNVVVLIPTNKLLSSMPRMMDVKNRGFGIKQIHYVGSGRQIKFPFGFPVGAVHMQRNYEEGTEITYSDRCRNAKAKRAV